VGERADGRHRGGVVSVVWGHRRGRAGPRAGGGRHLSSPVLVPRGPGRVALTKRSGTCGGVR
jgi:hypothetical protein